MLEEKSSCRMDGHLVIGLPVFKHVLVSLFCYSVSFLSDALCGVVVFSNSYMYQSIQRLKYD